MVGVRVYCVKSVSGIYDKDQEKCTDFNITFDPVDATVQPFHQRTIDHFIVELHKMDDCVEGTIVFSVMNSKQQCTSLYLEANVKGYRRVASEHDNDLYDVDDDPMDLNENMVTEQPHGLNMLL